MKPNTIRKHIVLFAVFLISTAVINAQSLAPQMINTCGGGSFVGTTHYDFSVGEPLTHFGGSSCDSIFSGFQHCAIDTLRFKKFNLTITGKTTFCNGGLVNLSTFSASSYTWSTGANTSSINVTSSGVYSTTVTTTCGNVIASKPVTVTVINPPTPQICMVTTDSLGVNNEIYWEKTLYPQADSFIVYREVSTNVYSRIGSVYKTNFSMYTDTNRSIGPNNGNPKLSSYKYKLQIVDTCHNYSSLSLWHQTIFIQDQQNGNFNWNSYAIESTTSPVANYNLKRRNLLTGVETLVGSTSANLITDPNYSTFWPTQTKWLVDAIGFNCNPTTKMMVLKSKTKSNQSNDKTFPTSFNDAGLGNFINVYPNPSTGVLNIDLRLIKSQEYQVELHNMLGQIVYSNTETNNLHVINTTYLNKGIYILNIKLNNQSITIKRVILQ